MTYAGLLPDIEALLDAGVTITVYKAPEGHYGARFDKGEMRAGFVWDRRTPPDWGELELLMGRLAMMRL